MTSATTRLVEARRNVHETLTSLPAWDADAARGRLAALEQAVRDQAMTEGAALLKALRQVINASDNPAAEASALLLAARSTQEG